MKGNRIEKSAYNQIVELCYQHGVISSRKMTETELRVVLESLCAALTTSCPEQAALECQHFETKNRR